MLASKLAKQTPSLLNCVILSVAQKSCPFLLITSLYSEPGHHLLSQYNDRATAADDLLFRTFQINN